MQAANATLLSQIGDFLPRDDTFATDGYAPAVDGVDLKGTITSLIDQGQLAPNVTVLMGSNMDEGTLFMMLTPHIR